MVNRLTEKHIVDNIDCGYKVKKDTCEDGIVQDWNKTDAINKLGQLEDIEEELGIDLIILFKALANGFYGKRNLLGNPIQKIETSRYFSIKINSYKMIVYDSYDDDYGGDGWKLKDYGKTWALTKEELL